MSEQKTVIFDSWYNLHYRSVARQGNAWEDRCYRLRTTPAQRRRRGLNLKDNVRWLNEQIEKNRSTPNPTEA